MSNREPTINKTQKTKEMSNRNPTINTTQKPKDEVRNMNGNDNQ